MKITKWELGVCAVLALFIYVAYKYYTDMVKDREFERSELLKDVLKNVDTLNIPLDTLELNKNISMDELKRTKLSIDSILSDTITKRDTLKLNDAIKLLRKR